MKLYLHTSIDGDFRTTWLRHYFLKRYNFEGNLLRNMSITFY
jgi:hypothetical protein